VLTYKPEELDICELFDNIVDKALIPLF